tara:strand:+ start:446 stop:583 length:138 start_codon:yes stop_codon:yes gene_type:complete
MLIDVAYLLNFLPTNAVDPDRYGARMRLDLSSHYERLSPARDDVP